MNFLRACGRSKEGISGCSCCEDGRASTHKYTVGTRMLGAKKLIDTDGMCTLYPYCMARLVSFLASYCENCRFDSEKGTLLECGEYSIRHSVRVRGKTWTIAISDSSMFFKRHGLGMASSRSNNIGMFFTHIDTADRSQTHSFAKSLISVLLHAIRSSLRSHRKVDRPDLVSFD